MLGLGGALVKPRDHFLSGSEKKRKVEEGVTH